MPNSLLSDSAILRHKKAGNIVIDPFEKAQLNTASYDVTLGEWYWRQTAPKGTNLFNPYSREHTSRIWSAVQKAEPARKVFKDHGTMEGIDPKEKIILIRPRETLLCHTQEFIGGRGVVTTMLKTKSSMARIGIDVCRSGGWGDVGYINRWTMQVSNNSDYSIPLVVGRKIAQLVFFEVEPILSSDYTQKTGNYQKETDLKKLKQSWKPEDMLPKLYKR